MNFSEASAEIMLPAPTDLQYEEVLQMYTSGKNNNKKPKQKRNKTQKVNAMRITKCDVKYAEKSRMGFWSSGIPQPYSSPGGK